MSFKAKRRRKSGLTKSTSTSDDTTSLKIKLRGTDNAPLTMQQLTEGLLDAARHLKTYESGYRAKSATLYLIMVDERGQPVRVNEANELVIYPYASAADEHQI